MPAKHKYQNARLSVTTTLPPERLVELARTAGEAVTNKIPPGRRPSTSTTSIRWRSSSPLAPSVDS